MCHYCTLLSSCFSTAIKANFHTICVYLCELSWYAKPAHFPTSKNTILFCILQKDLKRKQNHQLVLPVMTIKMISILMVLRIRKHKDLSAGVTTTSAKIKQHHPSQEFPEDNLPITFTSRWRLIITCLASEQRSDPWPERKAIFRQSWKQTLHDPRSWASLFLEYAQLRLSHIALGFFCCWWWCSGFFSLQNRDLVDVSLLSFLWEVQNSTSCLSQITLEIFRWYNSMSAINLLFGGGGML